jgi:hypothetical protein
LNGWVTPRYARQLGDEGRKAASKGEQVGASGEVTPAERDSLRDAAAALRTSLARLDRTGR